MIDAEHEDIRQALKAAVEDANRSTAVLDRDLWPRMRARLDAPPPRLSWLDWALVAAIVCAAVAFPQLVLGVLYHL